MSRASLAIAAQNLLSACKISGATIASAESCTGGMIGETITSLPGASEAFFGSIVSYANEVKMRALGVRADTLANHGAVSEETAREMAEGARQLCGVTAAVSVTGIAGPGGGTPDKPIGTVCFAVATANGTLSERVQFDPSGTREEIRIASATHALQMLTAAVKGSVGCPTP